MLSAPSGSPRDRRRRPPVAAARDGPAAAAPRTGGRDVAGRRVGLCSRRGAGSAARRRGQRRHPRQLHRLRLRPVPRPRPALDEPLADPLAVPGRRHLHLRQLPRLPRPAQPHAAVDQHPAGQGLAAAAHHPRARRRRCQPRFPRYDDDPKINPKRGTDGLYQWARDAGHRRGHQDRRRRPGAGHRRRAARSGTTSRASTTTSPTAASRRWPSCRRGPTSCTRSATSPASTPAPAPASRCSTTRASSGPASSRLPDQIWIARWDVPANTSTSYIREDGWLPGGRMKQYQGGHDETWGGVRINIDRNYLDLGLGSVAAPRDPLRRGPHQLLALPRPRPRLDGQAGRAPCSACSRRRTCTPARSPACTTRPPSPPPTPG